MNGRYRVTVLAVELYDPLLIQRAVARAGGDGARTVSTLAIEVPGGFGPAVVAAVSSRAEADRLLASLTSAGIEAIVVDDGNPLLNKIRRAWMRLEGRDPDAKTTEPEQRVEAPPLDPLAPPGTEPDRVNFKLHRNADRVEVNPIDAIFGELRVHLVRLAGLIVVVLLFALPWYFMLGRVSKTESLKGGGGGEQVFRLSAGSGAQLPKVTLKGGPSDGSGGDPQREAEQMAAAAGSGGGNGKSGLPRGQGAGRPINPDDLVEEVHGDGSGGGGGKGGTSGGGGDPDAVNDQLKRTALLLIIAGLVGLVAGLFGGWLSFSRGKPGLRVVKSSWFWFAAAALAGGIVLGHYNTRQAALKQVAAKVQHEGSGSGSGSGSGEGSGSGSVAVTGSGEGSGSGAPDGSGSGAAKPAAAPPKSVAAQVAAMQGPPRANLAEMLRTLRTRKSEAAAKSASDGPSRRGRDASEGATGERAGGTAPGTATAPARPSASTAPSRSSVAAPTEAPSAGPAGQPAEAGGGKGDGKGGQRSRRDSAQAAPAPADEAAAPDAPTGGATGGSAAAPRADGGKLSAVESKVASMEEVPCEQQKNAYKAMLCKVRRERAAEAAAAAEKAAAEQAAGGREGAPAGPGQQSAPGEPGGGKGGQPVGAGGKQQPPMGRGLVAGVGFSVGFIVGLLLSLFYYRFYRR